MLHWLLPTLLHPLVLLSFFSSCSRTLFYIILALYNRTTGFATEWQIVPVCAPNWIRSRGQRGRNGGTIMETEKSRAAAIVRSLGRHFQVQELIPTCGQVDAAAIRFLLASGLWIFRWHLHNSVTASVVELDYCPLPLLLVFNSQRWMVARDASRLGIPNDTALFLLLLRSLCKINNSYWVDKFIRKSTGRRASAVLGEIVLLVHLAVFLLLHLICRCYPPSSFWRLPGAVCCNTMNYCTCSTIMNC